jgi:O-antigen/teichoic acid export membrane protein
MMVRMIVTLYTSRVVLQVLGVQDYGLYAVVGGVVGMLSFLNGALSSGSSRFLTFELGTGDFEKLSRTFSTLLNSHIILSVGLVILSETIGLWFVYNKLAVPNDRLNAAVWVYHISIFTSVITITQTPYNASIISHEKMNIYAYVSLVEVFLKLGVVYFLQMVSFDKLILYACLISMVTVGIACFYRFYCVWNFRETHYKLILDKNILKSVGGFSGWSLLGNGSVVLNAQGINIITNIFFNSSIVAARVISVQVNMAAMQFIQNFRTAVNPQIIKKYAAADYDGSKKLMLNSTKFSFYLMLLLGLPICILADPLLQIWLGQVPEYSVIFLQLIIIQSLFSVFDRSFIVAIQANGRLRENALVSPIIGIVKFIILYILFEAGFSPVTLSYAGIISSIIIGMIAKPIILCRIVKYPFQEIAQIFMNCFRVTLIAVPIPILINHFLNKGLINFAITCLLSVVCVLTTVYFAGIDPVMRSKVAAYAQNRLSRKR